MIYIAYVVVAFFVVLLSIKASEYVDMLEKTTSLSGAFVGGIMLSSVTSLPELFTSISATVFLDRPELCMGNVLGSNLFNLAALAVLLLLFFSQFCRARVSVSHTKVTVFVTLIYGVVMLNMSGILDSEIMTVSITSIIIVFIYIAGVKAMSEDNGGGGSDRQSVALSLRQILTRFFFTSVGIIVSSVIITYITDDISVRLNLGAGMAGAIFLGVATSLPEVSSTYALVRSGNFNIAVGNIIGSNLFNMTILTVADILYTGNGVYDFSDQQTQNLLLFGLVSTPVLALVLNGRGKLPRLLGCLVMVGCYILFLTT